MPDCCATCAHWTVARRTVYDDGSVVERFRAAEGKGACTLLSIETPGDFSCNRFVPDFSSGDPHVVDERKPGAPWQHWRMIDCPDCGGAGSSDDRKDDRCAGTGKVRLYDDGFVGDERTRRHPKEVAAKPKCVGCGADVEPTWKACPHCAHRLDAVAPTEEVAGLGAAGAEL